jgi:hypothetical protein
MSDEYSNILHIVSRRHFLSPNYVCRHGEQQLALIDHFDAIMQSHDSTAEDATAEEQAAVMIDALMMRFEACGECRRGLIDKRYDGLVFELNHVDFRRGKTGGGWRYHPRVWCGPPRAAYRKSGSDNYNLYGKMLRVFRAILVSQAESMHGETQSFGVGHKKLSNLCLADFMNDAE